MDDLWGNAWSDPSASASAPKSLPVQSSALSWTAASDISLSVPPDADAGFAQPAWNVTSSTPPIDDSWGGTGLTVHDAPGSPAWGGSVPTAWKESVEQDVSHSQDSDEEQEEVKDEETIPEEKAISPTFSALPIAANIPEPSVIVEHVDHSSPELEPLTPTKNELTFNDDLSAPAPVTPARSASPDGFGTFETGAMVDAPSWSSFPAPFSAIPEMPQEDSGWGGGGWPTATSTSYTADRDDDEGPGGEWATAHQQHSRQDRVPSQLVDAILSDWAELSVAMFSSKAAEPNGEADDDDDDWEGGLEKVEGLASMVNCVAPREMHLPPTVSLASTSIIKNMQLHVKLTRHLATSKLSPMSQLLASKGSTAWEASVKTRMDPVEDDWAWMGGKPKDLDQIPISEPATEKKAGGILASFWGRRAPTPAPVHTPSPAEDVAPKLASPKPKVESPKASPSPSVIISSSMSLPDVRRSSDSGMLGSYNTAILPSPATPEATDSSDVSNPNMDGPAPSAVSRFLGRFRTRSSNSSTSSLSSRTGHHVSLSESDFSFLEDVPTIPSDSDHNTPADQLKSLEDMLSSKPSVRASIAVPMIAPPSSRPPSSISRGSSSPVTPSATKPPVDDMWAIFEKPVLRAAMPTPKQPTIPLARMIGSTTTTSSPRSRTPSLLPVLAPPPRSSAPSSRSSTPQPSSPSLSQRPSAFPAPPRPPPKHAPGPSMEFGNFDTAFLPSGSTASPGGLTASPATPYSSRPALSPIVTGATPTSARETNFATPVNDSRIADDGFGDFMSPVQEQVVQTTSRSQLADPWPQERQASLGMPSPRISAPDTPLYSADANKPLPPPRRSLSPLMNKIAKVQSDKWPMPSMGPVGGNPVVLPPTLAPPPGMKQVLRPVADLMDGGALGMNVTISPPPANGQQNTSSGFTFPQPNRAQPSTSSVFAVMQQTAGTISPPAPLTAFSFPKPPTRNGSIPAPSVTPVSQTLKPAQVPSIAVQNGDRDGKLSAADLSFFEGL